MKYNFSLTQIVRILIAILLASTLLGVAPYDYVQISTYADVDAVPGEIIVQTSGDANPAQVQALAASVNGKVVGSINPLNLHLIKLPSGDNLNAKTGQAIDALNARSEVVFAEPNYIGYIDIPNVDTTAPERLNFTPNDPHRAK